MSENNYIRSEIQKKKNVISNHFRLINQKGVFKSSLLIFSGSLTKKSMNRQITATWTYIYKEIMEVKPKQRSTHSHLIFQSFLNLSPNYSIKIRACCFVKIRGQLGPYSHTQNEEIHKPKICIRGPIHCHFCCYQLKMCVANTPNNGFIYSQEMRQQKKNIDYLRNLICCLVLLQQSYRIQINISL